MGKIKLHFLSRIKANFIQRKECWIVALLMAGVFIQHHPIFNLGVVDDDDLMPLRGVMINRTRVVPFLLIRLCGILFDQNLNILHFITFSSHILVSVILFLVFKNLFNNPFIAVSSAIFFAIFPSNFYALGAYVYLENIFSLLFSLLTINYFWKFSCKGKFGYYFLSVLFYLLALNTKEFSIITVLFLPLILLIKKVGKGLGKNEVLYLLGHLILTLFYLVFFVSVVLNRSQSFDGIEKGLVLMVKKGIYIYSKLIAITFLFFLHDIGFFYLYSNIYRLVNFVSPIHLFAAIFASVIFSLPFRKENRTYLYLAWLWILASNLPLAFSEITHWWHQYHRYYFISPAFALFLSWFIYLIKEKFFKREWRNIIGLIFIATISLILLLNSPGDYFSSGPKLIIDKVINPRKIFEKINISDINSAFGHPIEIVQKNSIEMRGYRGGLILINKDTQKILDLISTGEKYRFCFHLEGFSKSYLLSLFPELEFARRRKRILEEIGETNFSIYIFDQNIVFFVNDQTNRLEEIYYSPRYLLK